jgi:hypothetical protein
MTNGLALSPRGYRRDHLYDHVLATAAVVTTGITDVACFAAMVDAVPHVMMTSTFSLTSAAAISANCSLRPSAQRYSIATVRPSIQPRSRSRCTKAATHWPMAEGVLEPKNPMIGSFPTCCARAASGHIAAAPPALHGCPFPRLQRTGLSVFSIMYAATFGATSSLVRIANR